MERVLIENIIIFVIIFIIIYMIYWFVINEIQINYLLKEIHSWEYGDEIMFTGDYYDVVKKRFVKDWLLLHFYYDGFVENFVVKMRKENDVIGQKTVYIDMKKSRYRYKNLSKEERARQKLREKLEKIYENNKKSAKI